MSRPLVSVLICNHDYKQYLGAAVESALAQSYSRIEVIVVDDGSTDGSRELIAAYSGRITAVLKDHRGLGAAVNAGLALCHGELIALLDADDVFLPTKIERVVAVSEYAPGATLYYHRLRTIDANGRPRGRSWPYDVWSGDIRQRIRDAGGWWPRPMTSAIVLARPFLERIAPFPEGGGPGRMCWPDAYAGDLAPFLGEIRAIPETLAHYRVHGRNRGLISPELQMRQYAFEVEQLAEGLQRLDQPTALAQLDRHLGFARAAAAARPGSVLLPAILLALRCPALGTRGRILEVIQILREALARLPNATKGRL